MSNVVTSTSESSQKSEAVNARLTEASKEEVKKSASTQNESDETQDESETSANSDESAKSDESLNEETQDEESEDSSKEEKSPKSKGFQKKINKLVRKVSEKEQELEYWKKEALRQKAQESDSKKADDQSSTKSASADAKPDPDKFESHEAYEDALLDWKIERREKQRQAKQKEEQVKAEFQKKAETFQSKLAEFQKANPDFDDVLEETEDVPGNIGVSESILASEIGPALMYELAKNKKDYARICALDPISAAREVGRIEARLLNKPEPSENKQPEKKQTKAPPPISPVGNGVSSPSNYKSLDDPSLSYSEFEKLRRQQAKKYK
jgi:hypothetical protein